MNECAVACRIPVFPAAVRLSNLPDIFQTDPRLLRRPAVHFCHPYLVRWNDPSAIAQYVSSSLYTVGNIICILLFYV